MAYDCFSCGSLDKSKRVEASNGLSFRYGCRNGYTCGWVIKDRPEKSQLSTMGCSNWIDRQKEEQLTTNDWLNITS